MRAVFWILALWMTSHLIHNLTIPLISPLEVGLFGEILMPDYPQYHEKSMMKFYE